MLTNDEEHTECINWRLYNVTKLIYLQQNGYVLNSRFYEDDGHRTIHKLLCSRQ